MKSDHSGSSPVYSYKVDQRQGQPEIYWTGSLKGGYRSWQHTRLPIATLAVLCSWQVVVEQEELWWYPCAYRGRNTCLLFRIKLEVKKIHGDPTWAQENGSRATSNDLTRQWDAWHDKKETKTQSKHQGCFQIFLKKT